MLVRRPGIGCGAAFIRASAVPGAPTGAADDTLAADCGATPAGVVDGPAGAQRAIVPVVTWRNATPLSPPGHGTSTHDPRLRLISSTVPRCAFPTTALAMLGDLCTSAGVVTVSSELCAAAFCGAADCPYSGDVLRQSAVARAKTLRFIGSSWQRGRSCPADDASVIPGGVTR